MPPPNVHKHQNMIKLFIAESSDFKLYIFRTIFNRLCKFVVFIFINFHLLNNSSKLYRKYTIVVRCIAYETDGVKCIEVKKLDRNKGTI